MGSKSSRDLDGVVAGAMKWIGFCVELFLYSGSGVSSSKLSKSLERNVLNREHG